jgi:hypothetical protein
MMNKKILSIDLKIDISTSIISIIFYNVTVTVCCILTHYVKIEHSVSFVQDYQHQQLHICTYLLMIMA